MCFITWTHIFTHSAVLLKVIQTLFGFCWTIAANPGHQTSNLQRMTSREKVTARPELRLWVSSLFGLSPAANSNLSRWLTTIQKECSPKGNDPIFGNNLRDVSLSWTHIF